MASEDADMPQEPSDKAELSRYLLDRLRQLEERNIRLREEAKRIETEKRFMENQKIRYEREVQKLTAEIERLKNTPLIVGTIIDIMPGDKVIIKSSTGPKFVVSKSQLICDVHPGTQVALNQQSLAVVDILPSPKDPMVYGMEIICKPNVDYSEVGGLEAQIQELKETIELPLTSPEKFEKVGIEPPKGVLLLGLPGTGKTLLAKAVAHRTNATFIKVVGSELVQKYIGEGARLVREIFKMAREKTPSIVFIDELDAIGSKRIESATSGDREVQRTLMQLLSEMDGFDPRGDVKLIAATNRPDILDPALVRPGRFDRMILVPMPSAEARRDIFKIHTKKMHLAQDVDFERLASLTDSASGADIKAIATEAGMFAIRGERDCVAKADFEAAIRKVMGVAQDSQKQTVGMFA
jgi:proteasome regulatory subunit